MCLPATPIASWRVGGFSLVHVFIRTLEYAVHTRPATGKADSASRGNAACHALAQGQGREKDGNNATSVVAGQTIRILLLFNSISRCCETAVGIPVQEHSLCHCCGELEAYLVVSCS